MKSIEVGLGSSPDATRVWLGSARAIEGHASRFGCASDDVPVELAVAALLGEELRRAPARECARAVIGWRPRDSSDGQVERVRGKVTEDPVTERYQGGVFVRADYSREDFPPAEMFPSPVDLPPQDRES